MTSVIDRLRVQGRPFRTRRGPSRINIAPNDTNPRDIVVPPHFFRSGINELTAQEVLRTLQCYSKISAQDMPLNGFSSFSVDHHKHVPYKLNLRGVGVSYSEPVGMSQREPLGVSHREPRLINKTEPVVGFDRDNYFMTHKMPRSVTPVKSKSVAGTQSNPRKVTRSNTDIRQTNNIDIRQTNYIDIRQTNSSSIPPRHVKMNFVDTSQDNISNLELKGEKLITRAQKYRGENGDFGNTDLCFEADADWFDQYPLQTPRMNSRIQMWLNDDCDNTGINTIPSPRNTRSDMTIRNSIKLRSESPVQRSTTSVSKKKHVFDSVDSYINFNRPATSRYPSEKKTHKNRSAIIPSLSVTSFCDPDKRRQTRPKPKYQHAVHAPRPIKGLTDLVRMSAAKSDELLRGKLCCSLAPDAESVTDASDGSLDEFDYKRSDNNLVVRLNDAIGDTNQSHRQT